MSDTIRHHDCPHVHLGGAAVCRDCRRLYERDDVSQAVPDVGEPAGSRKQDHSKAGDVLVSPAVSKPDAQAASKSERLEVARTALSNAEKCRRYRATKRLDPEWLKSEAARKRRKRETIDATDGERLIPDEEVPMVSDGTHWKRGE